MKIATTCALAATLILAGCHSNPTLYQWGSYQPQVYQHFKGEKSPNEQIDVLEKDLATITSQGKNPPPGYHAHLGMLYSMVGKQDLMVAEFESEKKLFPESSAYMDFLLKNTKKAVN